MNTYSRRTFALGLAAALSAPFAFALAGCTSTDGNTAKDEAPQEDTGATYKLVNAGKLTIGSDLAYPPMEYMDGEEPTGFGVAMMQEICKRLELECNFLSPQNFDTLVTQVAGGSTMDVAMSSITITDEREETIDFTEPYYDSNQAIVVLAADGFSARADLEGLPMGAQSGSTGEGWIRENYPNSEYIPYNTPAEALAGMRAGKVKAVVYDEPVASNNVAGEYEDCAILDVIATGEQYGIAVNQNNTALTAAINEALSAMKKDGTLDSLKQEWIG